MNISLIIFCYNEFGNIQSVLEQSEQLLSEIADDFELIVVNDGSNDGTSKLLIELKKKINFVLINHNRNLGIGQALQSGYKATSLEYVCAIPGDGQFDLNELRQVKPFDNSTYYSFYRPVTNYNRYRKTLTWLNRVYNQHLLAVFLRDVNWIKVYRLDQLKMTNPVLKSSLVESEICAKLYKRGITPIEIPSKYLTRESGAAKGGSFKILRKIIPETLKLFWVIHFR